MSAKKLRLTKAQLAAMRKKVAAKSQRMRIGVDKARAHRQKAVKGGRPGRKVRRSADELGHPEPTLTKKDKAKYNPGKAKGGGYKGFQKGNPGRPKGSRDKIPKSVKASIKALCEEIAADPKGNKSIRSAITRGIRAHVKYAHLYVRLVAEYVDGKPVDTLNLNTQFKQEDLETAGKRIGAKLERMISAVLSRKRAREEAERASASEPQMGSGDNAGNAG